MSGIRTAFEITEGMRLPLLNIINSVNLLVSSFELMQSASEGTVNTSEINGAREQIDEATMSLNRMEEAARNAASAVSETHIEPIQRSNEALDSGPLHDTAEAVVPEPTVSFVSEPMQVPREWQSPDTIEIFTNSGMERYEQEVGSANQMLNQLIQNQQRIAELSDQTGLFPQNMLVDLQALDSRIQRLRVNIQQISSNPIGSLGIGAVNNNIEVLRNQLSQAVSLQNDLTSAMERMDISEMNEAYSRLNSAFDSSDRHIRENMDNQNQFNGDIDRMQKKILGAVTAFASFSTVSDIMNLSDTLSETKVRLNMIVDDGGSVEELEQQIFMSAQRSRTSYSTTADMVTQLGQRAGDAFGSNRETIQFAENLNKQFMIAGASQQDSQSAFMNLTQALGSGVVKGEELNAVFEAAPNVIQTIADYLGLPMNEILQMASEGEITSQIIKNALLSATDDINNEFEKVPITFSQAWTSIQNDLLMTFQPLLEAIGAAAGWIYENWSSLEPLFWGLTAAVGAYTIGLGLQTLATWIATGKAQAFFAALMTNPLTWIALAIGVLVALIYRWIQSVGGIKIAWLIAMNVVKTVWDLTCLGFMIGVYRVLNFFDTLMLGIKFASVCIQNYIGDMKTGALLLLQGLVNGAIDIINDFIGVLNHIPGVQIDTIQNVTFGTAAFLENEAAKKLRESELQEYKDNISDNFLEREAALNQMKMDLITAAKERLTEIDMLQSQVDQEQTFGSSPLENEVTGMAEDVSGIREAVDISNEDLKYMRDLAEMEAINRFTTAEIKIEQTNHNSIRSNMDLDGITSYLTEGLSDVIKIAAEGVHN